MRRYLLLGIFALGTTQAGCALYYPPDHENSPYSYCDTSGCYECDSYSCWRVSGGDGTGWCASNADCAAACYCEAASGTCIETGFCSSNADCFDGMVCDDRSSCVPPETIGPPAGCSADAECAAGCFCDEASGACIESPFCSTDADCGVGWTCDGRSTCIPVVSGCTADAECAAACYCEELNGTCIESGYCAADADCAWLGMECDESRSTCIPPEVVTPTACTLDADCAAGQTCCDGECKDARIPGDVGNCTYSGECGGGLCVDGSCHPACTTNADCGTGDICAIDGYCTSDPAPTPVCVFNADCGDATAFTCINGYCHSNCLDDAQCLNPADFCEIGVCQPDWRTVSECAITNDCASTEACVDGQCRTDCMQDSDCDLCVDGPVCGAGGYCEE